MAKRRQQAPSEHRTRYEREAKAAEEKRRRSVYLVTALVAVLIALLIGLALYGYLSGAWDAPTTT